jgi:flagellar P-ring protein precursor FlgI
MVTAELPAFAKEGTRLDVVIDSLYNCKSLEGGTLLETHLTGPGGDDTVYAVAQGPVSIGGYNAGGGGAGGGATFRKNHATAGRVPRGAYVENEAPSTITDGERIMLLLKSPDFTTANNIQQQINEERKRHAALQEELNALRIALATGEKQRASLDADLHRVRREAEHLRAQAASARQKLAESRESARREEEAVAANSQGLQDKSTARAGATGIAISFCCAEEVGLLKGIERLTKCPLTVDESHHFHSAATAALYKSHGASTMTLPRPESRRDSKPRSRRHFGRPGRIQRSK